jgi:hypothetical protein
VGVRRVRRGSKRCPARLLLLLLLLLLRQPGGIQLV